MRKAGFAALSAAIVLAISQVALAGPVESPAVHTVDCTETGAVVEVTLEEGHYVIISDGDGFSMRIDGPSNETIVLETGAYSWVGYGIDDTGQAWKKGKGEVVAEGCPDEEPAPTSAPPEGPPTDDLPPPEERQPETEQPGPETPAGPGTETLPEPTSTVAADVNPTIVMAVSSTIPVVSAGDTLPFTGPETESMLGLVVAAVALILAGGVTLAARRGER